MKARAWSKLSFFEQMANIGSEVFRTINWRIKKNSDYEKMAFNRVLELLILTIGDRKNINRLRELCRLKEVIIDYFAFNNIYNSSDVLLNNYFYGFNYALKIKS